MHNLCASNMLSMDLIESMIAPNGGWCCIVGGWAATLAHVRGGLELCDGVFSTGKWGWCRAEATVGVGVDGGCCLWLASRWENCRCCRYLGHPVKFAGWSPLQLTQLGGAPGGLVHSFVA